MALIQGKFLANDSITGDKIAASANIDVSKITALTASKALESDASGVISASSVTSAELSRLSGVTSAIQTQLNAKIASTEKGAASGVATLDGSSHVPLSQIGGLTNSEISASAAIALSKLAALSAGKVLVSDGSGVIAVDTVTTATLLFLDATSSVQGQLNAKLASSEKGAASGVATLDGSSHVPLAELSGITTSELSATAGILYSQMNIPDATIPEAKISGLVSDLASKLPLAGGVMSGDIDMNNVVKVKNLPAPTAANDAVTKAYADGLAITGGAVKEALLSNLQLVDGVSGGISSAEIFFLHHNVTTLVDGDFLVITDGSNTETFTFKNTPVGAFDVQIDSDEGISELNLVNSINANSLHWIAEKVESGLNFIDQSVVVIADKVPSSSSSSRLFGTFANASDVHVVEYNGTSEYSTSKVQIAIPAVDPAAGRFGIGKAVGSMVDGELHVTLELNEIHSWNSSSDLWHTMSGGGSVPNATAGSGGAVLGKITADSDKGLAISSGVLTVKVDAASFQFSGAGAIQLKSAGVADSMLASTFVKTVNSVSPSAGNVVLTSDDVSEGTTNEYFLASRAKAAAVADAIVNGITDVAPSQNAVFDALALKADDSVTVKSVNSQTPTAGNVVLTTDNVSEGATNKYFSASAAKSAAVADAIVNGVTDVAPSQNAVFDALALKLSLADVDNSTTKINGVNKLESLKKMDQLITLLSGDIGSQYVDLAQTAHAATGISLTPVGGLMQERGVDFTVSLSGGAGGVTRISFAGDLGTGGAAELIAGDKIVVSFDYL